MTAYSELCSKHGFGAQWIPQSLKVPSESLCLRDSTLAEHLACPFHLDFFLPLDSSTHVQMHPSWISVLHPLLSSLEVEEWGGSLPGMEHGLCAAWLRGWVSPGERGFLVTFPSLTVRSSQLCLQAGSSSNLSEDFLPFLVPSRRHPLPGHLCFLRRKNSDKQGASASCLLEGGRFCGGANSESDCWAGWGLGSGGILNFQGQAPLFCLSGQSLADMTTSGNQSRCRQGRES